MLADGVDRADDVVADADGDAGTTSSISGRNVFQSPYHSNALPARAAKPAAAKPRARAKSAGPRRGGGDFKVGMREAVPAQRRPYEQFQRPHSATVIR